MRRYSIIRVVLLGGLSISTAWATEISISNTNPLVFGSFAAGSGGAVIVSTNSLCSTTGDVMLMASNACASAEFTVSGDPALTYLIELPANDFVKLTGPGNDMGIVNFTSTPSDVNGLIGAGGSQVLSVGGTLDVGNNQAPGDYSGNFTVIVNYN